MAFTSVTKALKVKQPVNVGRMSMEHVSCVHPSEMLGHNKRNARSQLASLKGMRQWAAGIRQVVETVLAKLHHTFGLDRERPHDLIGFQVRLLSKIALHNFCALCNWIHKRPAMAFDDLLLW